MTHMSIVFKESGLFHKNSWLKKKTSAIRFNHSKSGLWISYFPAFIRCDITNSHLVLYSNGYETMITQKYHASEIDIYD